MSLFAGLPTLVLGGEKVGKLIDIFAVSGQGMGRIILHRQIHEPVFYRHQKIVGNGEVAVGGVHGIVQK